MTNLDFAALIILDTIRLVPLIAVLAYAAWKDHKHGEVTNKIWLYTPIGLALTVAEYASVFPMILVVCTLSIVAATVFSLVLFYLNQWGGADTKALITIASCYPLTPLLSLTPLTFMPILTLLFAAIVAAIVGTVKKKKTLKFLPYLLLGLTLASII